MKIQALGLLVYLFLSGDIAEINTPIHLFFKTNLSDRVTEAINTGEPEGSEKLGLGHKFRLREFRGQNSIPGLL